MKTFCRSLFAAIALVLAAPALATVPSSSSSVDLVADGVGVEFAFTFKTLAVADVEVLVDGVKQASGFSVALAANQDASPGGTVTFTAPPAANAAVRIQRTVPLTQATSLPVGGPFPSKTVERTFDRLTMGLQQLDRRIGDLTFDDLGGSVCPTCATEDFLRTAADGTAVGVTLAELLIGAAGYGPPPAPVLNAVATPTNASPIPLSGTNSLNTDAIRVYVDGELTETSAPVGSVWTSWLTLSEGSYDVATRASNEFGLSNASPAQTIVVDRTAPLLTFSLPPTSTETVTLTISATDAIGVTGYCVKESSSVPLAADACFVSPAPAVYDFPLGTIGSMTLYAWARDGAGNVSLTGSDTVLVAMGLVHFPFATNGDYLAEDAGSVIHVMWDGAALLDTKGNAWVPSNGTIPQNAPTPLYANGWSSPPVPGVGPMRSGDYYRLGGGVDVADFSGDFNACIAFIPWQYPLADTSLVTDFFSDTGWKIYMTPAGVMAFSFRGTGSTITFGFGTATLGALNVACVGASGSTAYAKLNAENVVSSAFTAPIVAGTSTPLNLGGFVNGTFVFFSASTTAWDTGAITTRMQDVLGITGQGGPLVSTRTDTGSYITPDGLLWWSPPKVPRYHCEDGICGLLIETWITNAILRSEEMGGAPWVASGFNLSGPTQTNNQAAGLDGLLTAEQLDYPAVSAGNASYLAQPFTATAAKHTGSVYVRGVSGSGTTHVFIFSGGTYYSAPCAFTSSSWTRCAVTTSANLTAASWTFAVGTDLRDVGQSSTPEQSLYAWGAQIERQPWITTYIKTEGATRARDSDRPSVATPLADLNTFCIKGTYTPVGGRSWQPGYGIATGLFAFGPVAANRVDVRIHSSAATMELYTMDASGGVRNPYFSIAGWAAGSTKALRFIRDQGWDEIWVDGANQALTPQGTGTGVIVTPDPTLYVGAMANSGNEIGAILRNFEVYDNAGCAPE